VTEQNVSDQPSPQRLPFAAPVARELEAVERLLHDIVPRDIPILSDIQARLMSGGKRLRPSLLLLSARLFRVLRPQDEAVFKAAAAVETVHLASLLHDDLVDNSPVRRGEPSIQEQYGLGAALLAGDYLAAAAYRRLCLQSRTRALTLLANAVASMCEAEFTVIASNSGMDRRTYAASAAGKTGALMSAACEMGAVEAGADLEPAQLLGAYGRELGIAFQIADDVLDIFGSPAVSGKPVGQDLVSGQPNLVVILALEADQDGSLRAALESLETHKPADLEARAEVIEQMRRLRAGEQAHAIARDYANRARGFLSRLPACPAREGLEAATEYVANRSLLGSRRSAR